MHDWRNLTYLLTGTPRQRQAHAALTELGILGTLQRYKPVLAGTIPLALDLPSSDLDLICQVSEASMPAFEELLRYHYRHFPDFVCTRTLQQNLPTVVSSFWALGFAWEIFAQPQPPEAQQAVRHLQVEYDLLQVGGEACRQAILRLKQQGMKTEPAFAHWLGLPGDPYAAVLALEGLDSAGLLPYVLK